MRLGVEVTTCAAGRTGVGYYTEHLVDALLETCAEGDEVVLLSNRPPAPELAARWSPHLRVGGSRVRALWMQTDAPRMLSEAGADVAVFPNYVVPLASPCPTIVVVHDLALIQTPHHFTLRKRVLLRPILRQSVASAAVIATVSETSMRDITALLGVPRARMALLPCAAHPSCKPAPAEDVAAMRARQGLARPYVLTVGTLEPRKNLLTVLRAWDQLGLETHDLAVVGGRGWHDRDLVQALSARAQRRGVRWLGYVDERDLVALYSGADAFVFASTLEGFGMPVLEAMACGTPVIASDIAAHREVGGAVPRFAPPDDEAAFASAIAEAVSSRGPATRREAGLARARDFSWTETAKALWSRARATGPVRLAAATARREPAHSPAASEIQPKLPRPLYPLPHGLSVDEWALLATVVYADLFNSPLPLRNATAAAVGVVLTESEVLALARGPALSTLLSLHPAGYLTLSGREHLVDPVPERERLSHDLLHRHHRRLASLSTLPFVRALLISGGIAQRNPGARPDIDLFVVAARGRAYTTYTMFFLATKLTGMRHVICPNYLVDEGELAIAFHRDLFTAHQLVSSEPFSGQSTYEALCHANEAWVRHFFPSFSARAESAPQPPSALQHAGELALWPAAPVVEAVLRAAWRFRLRRRAARAARADVVLSNGILKLHLSDYRGSVMDRFAGRLEELRAQLASAGHTAAGSGVLDSMGT